jgi:hypothetical protein
MSEPDDKLWRRSKFRGEGWVSAQDDPYVEASGTFWKIKRAPPDPGYFDDDPSRPPHWIITLYRGEQERQVTLILPMCPDSYLPDPTARYNVNLNEGLAKELGILQTYLPENASTPFLSLRPRAPGEWKAEE